MTLDGLRDEIATAIFDQFYGGGSGAKIDGIAASIAKAYAAAAIDAITRHIPADVLAGLLEDRA